MEIKVLEEDKNKIKLEIEGETHTIANILTKYLLENPDIEISMYQVPHPLEERAIVYIVTKNKDPKKIIKETVDKIIKDLEKLKL